jgi:hypothetical protein
MENVGEKRRGSAWRTTFLDKNPSARRPSLTAKGESTLANVLKRKLGMNHWARLRPTKVPERHGKNSWLYICLKALSGPHAV